MKTGIISDIHEDVHSLERALMKLDKLGCQEIICLGDITGYDPEIYQFKTPPDAGRCIDLIRQHVKHVVVGNHDLFTARKIPVDPAGFSYPGNWFDLDPKERQYISQHQVWTYPTEILPDTLENEQLEYLRSLPDFLTVVIDGLSIIISHHIFPDISGTREEMPQHTHDFEKHLRMMETQACVMGFSGHLHPDVTVVVDRRGIVFKKKTLFSQNLSPIQYICPCVARGPQKSGFLVFDSGIMEIRHFPI